MSDKLDIVGKNSNRKSNTKWTEQQDQYLKEVYAGASWEEMTEHLGRSNKAIRDRARKLGVKRNRYGKTNEQFVNEFYNIFSRDEYILLSEYQSNHKHVEYFHVECGKTNRSTPASLLGGHGCICRKVNSNKVSFDEFQHRLEKIGEGKYLLEEGSTYVDTKTRVVLRHTECGNTYQTTPFNFFNGRGCPFCANKKNSKGERMVEKALNFLGFDYLEQATFEGMIYKKQLYYDFLLEGEDIIIEYQGRQHYTPVEFLGGFDKFESQLKRDKIKARYAEDNGYKLVEIPYKLDTYTKVLKYLTEELLM